jgi:hypothetical protein
MALVGGSAADDRDGRRPLGVERGRAGRRHCLELLLRCSSAVPGDPESGPFYLFRGLLGRRAPVPVAKPARRRRSTIYTRALAALGALGQSPLPYCAPDVIGNDRLYAGASEYVKQLQESCDSLLEPALLGAISPPPTRQQGRRAPVPARRRAVRRHERRAAASRPSRRRCCSRSARWPSSDREEARSWPPTSKLLRKHARALASGAVLGRDASAIDAASDEDVLRARELYRRLKDAIEADDAPKPTSEKHGKKK